MGHQHRAVISYLQHPTNRPSITLVPRQTGSSIKMFVWKISNCLGASRSKPGLQLASSLNFLTMIYLAAVCSLAGYLQTHHNTIKLIRDPTTGYTPPCNAFLITGSFWLLIENCCLPPGSSPSPGSVRHATLSRSYKQTLKSVCSVTDAWRRPCPKSENSLQFAVVEAIQAAARLLVSLLAFQ